MHHRQADLDDLILRIHAASLTEDGWPPIVEEISRRVGGESAMMVYHPTAAASSAPWALLKNFDAADWVDYARWWVGHDAWYQGAERTQRIKTGYVSVGEQLVERRAFICSGYFNDFLTRIDADRFLNVCLSDAASGEANASLNFYRGVGKAEFHSSDVELLERLSPHLVIAAGHHFKSKALHLSGALREAALDTVNAAVFVLAASGQIAFANALGEELLVQGRWVRVGRNQSLLPGIGVQRSDRLSKALRKGVLGTGSSHVVTDAVGAQAMIAIVPIPNTMPCGGLPRPAVLLWVTPVAIPRSAALDLAQLFDLSKAETRLLACLITGKELRDATDALGIALSTARTQLRALFRKTGRRNQSQLLALAGRLSAVRRTGPS